MASSRALRVVAAFGLLAVLIAVALAGNSPAAPGTGLEQAIAVQERNSDRLLARGAIVGTGVGRDESGGAEIVVLAERRVRVAKALSGIPVELRVTGPISSLRLASPAKKPENPGSGKGNGGGGGGEEEPSLSPTDRFPRPVPIGVSTGNAGECSSGTIGARVKRGSEVFALSNNHVYALRNAAAIGSPVLQPGRYDTECSWSAEDAIGSLAEFEEISFSGDNEIDAAIASIDEEAGEPVVGNSTPGDGYGTPSSEIMVGIGPVQKYGRTTGETHGYAYAVNGIVNVNYSGSTARFVNQVFVEGRKGPFLKAGDSGSLLVTEGGANPVGLLFAGNQSGKLGVANPIDAVLDAFEVTIDGE